MSEELKNFQNTLSTNNEMKQNFVDSKQNESSSEDDSESESDCDHIKISSQRKKNKNKNLENMLLEQSIIQQNAFLKAQNSNLKEQLKQTILELTAEIEARKETSELLMKAGNELNQLNRLVQKRGKDGRYISK